MRPEKKAETERIFVFFRRALTFWKRLLAGHSAREKSCGVSGEKCEMDRERKTIAGIFIATIILFVFVSRASAGFDGATEEESGKIKSFAQNAFVETKAGARSFFILSKPSLVSAAKKTAESLADFGKTFGNSPKYFARKAYGVGSMMAAGPQALAEGVSKTSADRKSVV